jgi:hypothetical protein
VRPGDAIEDVDPRLGGCFWSGRVCSSFLLIPSCTKTDANTATIFRYEFNACSLQRTADSQIICCGHAGSLQRYNLIVQRGGLSLSLGWFLGEAHARAAAVLVDELYATGFKASPHHLERCATRLMRTCLELPHSYNADTRLLGEFLLAPIKEAASGSALRR